MLCSRWYRWWVQHCILILSFTCGLQGTDLNNVVKLGQVENVQRLLHAGANTDIRDSLGWTPLHNAANAGQYELVQLLLNHQADPDSREPLQERSPLHLAAYSGYQAIVLLLLDAGASIDLRDVHGQTPLHLAVWRGRVQVVAVLLQRGAGVDVQDDRGSTPVMLAAIQNVAEVAKELLIFCPDLRILDKQDQNVLRYIKEKNMTKIHDMLFEHLQRPCRHPVIWQPPTMRSTTKVEGKNCLAGEKRYPGNPSPWQWWLPMTAAGGSVDVLCPPGTNGSASWLCGRDGNWEKTADLSWCRAVPFNGWQRVVGTGNVSAGEVMKDLVSSVQSFLLAPGDLLTLSFVLNILSEKHSKDAHCSQIQLNGIREAQDYLHNLLDVVDKMLLRSVAWWGLPHHYIATTASHIQTTVAMAALTLATCQKTPSQHISQERLYAKMVQQPPAYFSPLSHRTFSHHQHNHTSLTLPLQFYKDYVKHLSTVKVIFVSYSNLHCFFNSLPCDPKEVEVATDLPAPRQINSAILGARVGGSITWHAPLGEVVAVELQHVYSGHSFLLGKPHCVWWDEHSTSWATDGCHLAFTSPTHTLCHCNHLANMAVIMDIEGHRENLGDMRGKLCKLIKANLCFCLVATELVMLGSLGASGKPGPCAAAAVVFHYVTLTTFIWSAMEAVYTYVTTIKNVEEVGPWAMWCCLSVGYFVPMVYVVTIQALSLSLAHHTFPVCQLAPRNFGWTVVSPLGVIVLINVVALVMGACGSWCKDSGIKTTRTPRPGLCSSLSVFALLCLTWITGLLYFIEGSQEVALIFSILNFSLGVSILFLHVIMERHGTKS
ncbi:adhesion G protein-coupled receptor E3-like isoform X3 [Portunus trituberculatus]|uniref:adhesion G protein-coupled receptor E3-like isoform X3 n=1 Tax=Portunus trituberculatus TaxID=210409 RepID=UPI001E1CE371|nr:adhesion G protein-coupled receptor E3-like isoform X3 [Portunus trituberculatus]